MAFYRYIVVSPITGFHWVIYLILLTVISVGSYLLLEVKLGSMQKTDKLRGWLIGITALVCAVEMAVGGWIYLRAGVMRDIPELGVTVENAHRRMHAEYVDRI